MTAEKLVVGLTGMPGAGKSVVVSVAKLMGYGIVVMGDVVREETTKRGLEPTPENIGKIMLELRRNEGKSVMAQRSVSKIEQAEERKIIVDGIRSLSEVEEFKKRFRNFILMAVYASPETRFKRLFSRRRSDDAEDWEVFHERDMRELSVGLGEAIAMAEHVIVNEEEMQVVKEKIETVLRKAEEGWKK